MQDLFENIMPITFVGKQPKLFKTPAEEILWIREHVRIKGMPMTRQQFSDVLGYAPSTVDAWLAEARERKGLVRKVGSGPRKSGRQIKPQSLKLIRLELGLIKPFCDILKKAEEEAGANI